MVNPLEIAPPSKRCAVCGEMKSTSDFYRSRSEKDGLQRKCRACDKAYRDANKERKRERNREYREKNREALREKRKEWERKNLAEWRASYKARLRELRMGYYRQDPEKYKQATAEWRANNPGKSAEYTARYRQENPEVVAAHSTIRHARRRSATRGDTRALRAAIVKIRSAEKIACYWCGKATRKGQRHIDHIIPLAKGGAHAPENLCCSCPACNLAKGAKMPFEYRGQAELAF